MEYINDLIKKLTITSKTPDGVSIYETGSSSSIKSLYTLFSELSDICDEINDEDLYNLVLLFSAIGEGYKDG
jgi:hypothetical protein